MASNTNVPNKSIKEMSREEKSEAGRKGGQASGGNKGSSSGNR